MQPLGKLEMIDNVHCTVPQLIRSKKTKLARFSLENWMYTVHIPLQSPNGGAGQGLLRPLIKLIWTSLTLDSFPNGCINHYLVSIIHNCYGLYQSPK